MSDKKTAEVARKGMKPRLVRGQDKRWVLCVRLQSGSGYRDEAASFPQWRDAVQSLANLYEMSLVAR